MLKNNPDKENRDLERAALTGDEAAAMQLYLNLLREDKIQPTPKISYDIPPHNSTYVEIDLFNPNDFGAIKDISPNQLRIIVSQFRDYQNVGSYPFIWEPNKFDVNNSIFGQFSGVIKNTVAGRTAIAWAKTHQKEIKDACIAALHHKLFMFHQAYQRQLDNLKTDKNNLTKTIIEVLQTENTMYKPRRNPDENIRNLQRQWDATNDPIIAYKLVIEYRRRHEQPTLDILDAATPLLIQNQPFIDFRDILQENVMRLGTRYNRTFHSIKFDSNIIHYPMSNIIHYPISLSIQASAFHFCEPEGTHKDLTLYTNWEVLGNFPNPNETPELQSMPYARYFTEFDSIARHMPTQQVQELFDWFRARFGLIS